MSRTPQTLREPLGRLLGRRILSTLGLFLLTALWLALLPALLLAALIFDLGWSRRRGLGASRVVLALAGSLVLHVVGLGLLVTVPLYRWDQRSRAEQVLRIEIWWARAALWLTGRLFGVSFEVEAGAACLGIGGFILLPRHASLIDTLLPIVFVAGPHRHHLRYVMKSQLLWDPCIDALGHRAPTAFVERGGRQHTPEIRKVVDLGRGMGGRDVVVLFPEGTRFTREKRARRLAWLAERAPAQKARAERLRHLLSPRVGGLWALLDDHPVDVVICAHVGLEGINRFSDLLDGTLIGRRVRLAFWRVPAVEIPEDHEARLDWFYDWWERVDAWIDARIERPPVRRGHGPPKRDAEEPQS